MTPLKEQWREELHKTRFFQEGGFCFEACDYERMCGDMEFFVEMLVKHTHTQALESLLEKVQKMKKENPKTHVCLNLDCIKFTSEITKKEICIHQAMVEEYNQALSDLTTAIKNEQ